MNLFVVRLIDYVLSTFLFKMFASSAIYIMQWKLYIELTDTTVR